VRRKADLPPYDPVHADEICRHILEAVSLDDFAAIGDLAKLVEIQARGGARSKPKYIPWPYYAGTAALSYPDQGHLPSKPQVRNEAIRQRVLEEPRASGSTAFCSSAMLGSTRQLAKPAMTGSKRTFIVYLPGFRISRRQTTCFGISQALGTSCRERQKKCLRQALRGDAAKNRQTCSASTRDFHLNGKLMQTVESAPR
jgi:hypothetical protein